MFQATRLAAVKWGGIMVFEKIAQPDSADDVARVVYSRRPAAEAARVNNSRHTCCCIYFSKTIIRHYVARFLVFLGVAREMTTAISVSALFLFAPPILRSSPQKEDRRARRNDQRPDPRVLPIGVECVCDDAQSSDDEENRRERVERDGPRAWGFRHRAAKDDQRDPGQREEYPVGEDRVPDQFVVPVRDGEERGQHALQQYRRRRRMKARTEPAQCLEEDAVSAHCIIDSRRGE